MNEVDILYVVATIQVAAIAWLTIRYQKMEKVLRWFAQNVTLVPDGSEGELPKELMDLIDPLNDEDPFD